MNEEFDDTPEENGHAVKRDIKTKHTKSHSQDILDRTLPMEDPLIV